eukprot:9484127-Pyramimonas_sp.AAC.1
MSWPQLAALCGSCDAFVVAVGRSNFQRIAMPVVPVTGCGQLATMFSVLPVGVIQRKSPGGLRSLAGEVWCEARPLLSGSNGFGSHGIRETEL